MDEAKKPRLLESDDDEFKEEIGHMLIYENPASPDPSPGNSRVQSPEPTPDKPDSNDSDYYADTINDSPRSTDTTFELQDDNELGGATDVGSLECQEQVESSDESEVGDGSPDPNEAHGITPRDSTIIKNDDDTEFLFSPRYRGIKKREEESEDEH